MKFDDYLSEKNVVQDIENILKKKVKNFNQSYKDYHGDSWSGKSKSSKYSPEEKNQYHAMSFLSLAKEGRGFGGMHDMKQPEYDSLDIKDAYDYTLQKFENSPEWTDLHSYLKKNKSEVLKHLENIVGSARSQSAAVAADIDRHRAAGGTNWSGD